MSRTSSLSGLGRGRARGRRDIAEGEQLAERRPGRSRAEDWEGELAGTQVMIGVAVDINGRQRSKPVFRLQYVKIGRTRVWLKKVKVVYSC